MNKFLLMKMQIAWFCFFTLVSLGSALDTALTGAQWDQIDNQTKFMICLGVFVSWGTTMMALFSKAMARVKDGGQPFEDDDSATTTKTVSASVQTTETKSNAQ